MKARLKRAWHWTLPLRYIGGEIQKAYRQTVNSLVTDTDTPLQVLDYGCGGTPYRNLFPQNCEYTAADMPGNTMADLDLTADGRVPLPDHQFDIVLSSQVLEHVSDPDLYLSECRRLLRPNGKLLLSTHGIMIYHPSPQDLWRWTADGLCLALQRNGLNVYHLQGIMGLVPTSLWMVAYEANERLPRGLRHALVLMCNGLCLILDKFSSDRSKRKNACVYLVVANAQDETEAAA